MTNCHPPVDVRGTVVLSASSKRLEVDNVGTHLRTERIRQGLTQQELARRCGLDQAHVARFEKGERTPTLIQLSRLAEQGLRILLRSENLG
jgi:predicted transcriptional regulator